MDDDPIGTVTERWSTAAPYPNTTSTVRKRYPDGMVRQWSRPSSTAAWVEEDVVDHPSGA